MKLILFGASGLIGSRIHHNLVSSTNIEYNVLTPSLRDNIDSEGNFSLNLLNHFEDTDIIINACGPNAYECVTDIHSANICYNIVPTLLLKYSSIYHFRYFQLTSTHSVTYQTLTFRPFLPFDITPVTAYSLYHNKLERLLLSASESSGFIHILRLSNSVGPPSVSTSFHLRHWLSLSNSIALSLYSTSTYEIRDPSLFRSLVPIRLNLDTLDAVLSSPCSSLYQLSSPYMLSLKDLLQAHYLCFSSISNSDIIDFVSSSLSCFSAYTDLVPISKPALASSIVSEIISSYKYLSLWPSQ